MELIKKYFPDLTDKQVYQLSALQPLYEEWNAKINVISRKDIPALYEKHVLHSLAIAKINPLVSGTTVLDIGTGGGFPGIPLSILFPEVKFHLVDSIGKKIKVVNAVSDALQLKNVTSEHNRAENIKHPPFDYVVTRAVASLDKLCSWGLPHLKKNKKSAVHPVLLALKGGDLAEEIAESGQHTELFSIKDFFAEDFFLEKYLLAVERRI